MTVRDNLQKAHRDCFLEPIAFTWVSLWLLATAKLIEYNPAQVSGVGVCWNTHFPWYLYLWALHLLEKIDTEELMTDKLKWEFWEVRDSFTYCYELKRLIIWPPVGSGTWVEIRWKWTQWSLSLLSFPL